MGKMKIIRGICILPILLFSHNAFAQVSRRSERISWEQIRRLFTEDHKRMMNLLGITSLQPGRNGMNPKAINYTNYDEAKANPYPDLPDLLVLKDGQKVTSARMWWNRRRPEIIEDFDREIYGRVPKETPKMTWEVAFHQHSGGHLPGPNRPTFLTFAHRCLHRN